jgi:hypothetical protein
MMSNSREPALAARLEAGAELQQPKRDVGGAAGRRRHRGRPPTPSASASAEASPRRLLFVPSGSDREEVHRLTYAANMVLTTGWSTVGGEGP